MENNMEAKASNGSIIKTGDMVLVRESDTHTWFVSLFSYKIKDNCFICINGFAWEQCIPLKDNEYLCGTNNKYEESYTPKFGDKVKGINKNNEEVTGILTFYNKEYKPYKYVVYTCLSTSEGFDSRTHVCKSVKPIKE